MLLLRQELGDARHRRRSFVIREHCAVSDVVYLGSDGILDQTAVGTAMAFRHLTRELCARAHGSTPMERAGWAV